MRTPMQRKGWTCFAALLSSLAVLGAGCDSGGSGGSDAPPYVAPDPIAVQWPNLRGPSGLGVSTDTGTPVSWDYSTSTNIAWRASVPKRGVSSPVVGEGRVFLTGGTAAAREVYCYNATDGTLLWTRTVAPAGSVPQTENSLDYMFAGPTPAFDGRNVYALFGNGDIAAIDYNGTTVWARNLGEPAVYYAHSSSLIVYDNLVLVQYDSNKAPNPSRFIALNTSTGATVWEQLPADRASTESYASPVIINDGSNDLVVTCTKPDVTAYDLGVIASSPADPNTAETWRVNVGRPVSYSSAAAAGGSVFTAVEYADVRAYSDAGVAGAANTSGSTPDYASPVAVVTGEGTLVFTIYMGAVKCIDASDMTTTVWTQNPFGGSCDVYASPIVVGDTLYVLNGSGVCYALDASKTYSVLGTGTLEALDPLAESGYWATPAFAGNKIYIRGVNHLYCISN